MDKAIAFRRQVLALQRSRFFALVSGTILCASLGDIRAQEETWVSPSGGLWSEDGSWLDGTAPPIGGSATLSLRFATPAPGSSTSTHDLGAGTFLANRLVFGQLGGRPLVLAAAPTRSITLTGSGSRISQTNAGAITITAPLALNPSDNLVTIDGAGVGNLTISGILSGLSGSQTLRIASTGASPNGQLITLSGANTIAGTVALESGNLALGSGALGAGKLLVRGGTLRFATASSSFANAVELESDLVVTSANNSTLAGVISSVAQGAGLRLRTNTTNPALRLTGASTYTGPTTIDFGPTSMQPYADAGVLRLAGSGSVLNTSEFDIRAGGTLAIETLTTGVTNRVADTTPITLRGGKLQLEVVTSTTASQAEVVGPINVSGYSSIIPSLTQRNVNLTAQSLTRLQRGTVLFRSATFGSTAASGARVLFTDAPALTGGGGSGPEISILPYAIGEEPISRVTGLVTYDAAGGIRLLNPTTEYAATFAAATPTSNVRLTSFTTLASATTVNALFMSGSGPSISGPGTLTLASGTLLGSSTASITSISAPLDFGAAEGQIFAPRDMVISGGISGSGGLTKSGSGTLLLNAPSTFSGPLTINAGLVRFAAVDRLGVDTGAITFNGGGGGLSWSGPTTLTLSRPLEIASGFGAVEAGSMSGILVLNAPVTGAGALRVGVTGPGTVRLNVANTHAGPTVVTSGTLELADDSVFGGGEVWIGATVRTRGDWTSSRGIRVLSGTLDTGGFNVTWNGAVTGGGSLAVSGGGTLAVTSPSPFSGNVTVTEATLTLRENASIQSTRITVNSGGRVHFDNATSSGSRLGAPLTTLGGGTLEITAGAVVPVRENIGTLDVQASGSGSTIRLLNPAGGSVVLQSTGLNRFNAEVLVRANGLGAPSGSASERLTFLNGLAAVEGIVPGLYAGPISGGGESFTTYDARSDAAGVIGLKSLASEYTPSARLENPTTPSSAQALIGTGATSGGATNTVRSLTFEAGGTLTQTGGQTLAVSSGQVLARSGGTGAALTGGTLAFAAQPGTVAVLGNLTLDAVVSGSAGWTKVGPGVLTLATQPAAAASLTIGTGPVRPLSALALAEQMVGMAGSGAILDLARGDASVGGLSGTGTVQTGGATLTLGTVGRDFTFSGTFATAGQVRIVDGGNPNALRTISLASAAGRTAFTLVSGRLGYTDTNVIDPLPLTLAGGTLEGTFGSVFQMPLILTGEARVRGSLRIASPATISGSGSLSVDASTDLGVEVPATHTGETIVDGDSAGLALRNAGALTATSAIRLARGALALNYLTVSVERLNDAAPIHMRHALVSATGPQGSTIIEKTGSIFAGPESELYLLPVTSTPESVIDLRPSQLARVDSGALKISSRNLGKLDAGQRVAIHPVVAPSMIGGAAASGPNTSIIPWSYSLLLDQESRHIFVTHDPTRGIRPLDFTADFAQGPAAVSAPTNNLLLTGSQTLDASLTVNSLLLSDATARPALTGAGTLVVSSGVILSDSFSGASIGTPMNFGSAEAHFIADRGPILVGGQISGSAGVTKSGSSALTLEGTNTFTGGVRVNGGNLLFGKDEAFGASSNAILLDTSSLFYNGTAPGVLTRAITVGAGGGRVGNLDANTTLTVTGTIRGVGAVTFGGSGVTHLKGVNEYTGETHVQTVGSLLFDSDAALGGGGAIRLLSGTLEPTFDWTTDRAIYPFTHGRVSTGPFDITWNGPVRGNEPLVKEGRGRLVINRPEEFFGSITLRDGTLLVSGSLPRNPAGTPTVFIDSLATLAGSGTWERAINSIGTLAPGDGVGSLTVGDVRLAPSGFQPERSTLALEIMSATLFDQLIVRGTFALVGVVGLSLQLGYDPADHLDSFVIVANDGTDPIIGAAPRHFSFAGNELEEGESFLVGNQLLRISYADGDGNDVVLYAVPEPTSALLLIAGLPCLLRRGRRRGSVA